MRDQDPILPASGITVGRVLQIFKSLGDLKDERRAPDESRRARFRTGWRKAANSTQTYTEKTLESLTWDNLGYRYGKELPGASREEIEAAFDVLAAKFWEGGRGRSGTDHSGTIDDEGEFLEGTCSQITCNRYERDLDARKACLEHYGFDCHCCGASLEEMYGAFAKQFIHVHHIEALADRGGPTPTDPTKGLVPVCPNCHAMIHLAEKLGIEVKSPKDVANFLEKLRDKRFNPQLKRKQI